jgi:hypothetical protein
MSAGAASLGLSIALSERNPEANFYLLPSRFWELLAGGALAVAMSPLTSDGSCNRHLLRLSARTRELLSAVGVLLFICSFALIASTRAYPGPWAFLPVLGTVSFIAAGPDAFVNRRCLGNGVAVWFGLISYPLYLWHWPLLAFVMIVGSDLGLPDNTVRIAKVLAGVAAIGLAHLTFRFVELPAQRYARSIWLPETRRPSALGRFVLPLVLIATVGLLTMMANGWPARYGGTRSESVQLKAASRETFLAHAPQHVSCELPIGFSRPSWCYRSTNAPPEVAVFGDSHAMVVYPGLVDALPKRSILLVAQVACPPIVRTPTNHALITLECAEANRSAMWLLRNSSSLRTVILVSRGPYYVTGKGFGRIDDSPAGMHQDANGDTAESPAGAFKEGMARTITALLGAGKQVVLIQDVPELGFRAEDCIVGRPFGLRRPRLPCAISKHEVDERNRHYRAILSELVATFPSVELFDAGAFLCNRIQCVAMAEGKLLYSDDDHLSLEGSLRLGAELKTVIRRMPLQ